MHPSDHESTDLKGAAHLARADAYPEDLPDPAEYMDYDDLACTHSGGEGLCDDGSDPLGNCPDEPHRYHACNGSGARKDQTIF